MHKLGVKTHQKPDDEDKSHSLKNCCTWTCWCSCQPEGISLNLIPMPAQPQYNITVPKTPNFMQQLSQNSQKINETIVIIW